MVNYISFSLFGTNPKYINGAIRNSELRHKFFPNWTPIYYIGNSISSEVERNLRSNGALIRRISFIENQSATLWRFLAVLESDANFVIFRDCDSRLSIRDNAAVSEWVKSGKDIHVIRDHPNHTARILSGLWGCFAPNVKDSLTGDLNFTSKSYYGIDQDYLENHIYKLFKSSILVHDSFFGIEKNAKSIPANRLNFEYLGESLDEFDNFDPKLRLLIKNFENSRKFRLKTRLNAFRKRFVREVVKTIKSLIFKFFKI